MFTPPPPELARAPRAAPDTRGAAKLSTPAGAAEGAAALNGLGMWGKLIFGTWIRDSALIRLLTALMTASIADLAMLNGPASSEPRPETALFRLPTRLDQRPRIASNTVAAASRMACQTPTTKSRTPLAAVRIAPMTACQRSLMALNTVAATSRICRQWLMMNTIASP